MVDPARGVLAAGIPRFDLVSDRVAPAPAVPARGNHG